MRSKNGPAAAESSSAKSTPSQDGRRGDLQSPHTAERQGRSSSVSRILTIRILPDEAQWKLLRERASQSAAYRNKHMQARLADALKWSTPPDAQRPTLTRHIRQTEQGDLGAAVYLGAEAEVDKDWTRAGSAVMAGAPMPQYRQKDSLAIASSQGGGVKVLAAADGFIVRLHIGKKNTPEGGWMAIPVHPETDRDEFRWPKLVEMANGSVPVTQGRVIFRLRKGKTLLQLTYRAERIIRPVGARIATLSEFEDGRLLLRAENGGTLDYSSRLAHLKSLKQNWDGLCRRFGRKSSRSRGSARRLSAKLDQFGLDRKTSTLMHQWSAEMVRWMVTQGCGKFTCATLIGGDWPAHKLESNLEYKCLEAAIEVVKPSLQQETTERAAAAAVKKKQRKAKKLGEALREVDHQLGKPHE
jgi:hypothetical protein